MKLTINSETINTNVLVQQKIYLENNGFTVYRSYLKSSGPYAYLIDIRTKNKLYNFTHNNITYNMLQKVIKVMNTIEGIK